MTFSVSGSSWNRPRSTSAFDEVLGDEVLDSRSEVEVDLDPGARPAEGALDVRRGLISNDRAHLCRGLIVVIQSISTKTSLRIGLAP